jgi:hypothetical protein
VQNHPKTSFWGNVLDNVQGAANTAGTFLDQVKGSPLFQDLAKQPQIKHFLLALEQVDIQNAQKHVQKIMRNHPDWNAEKVADQLILEKAFLLSTHRLVSGLLPGLIAVDLTSSLVFDFGQMKNTHLFIRSE